MGVLYSVYPLSPELYELLAERGVSFPRDAVGRAATPREIRMAASAAPGLIAECIGGDDFDQVDIHSPNAEEGPWTLLNILKRSGDDDPADFYFEKGWPEAILAVLIPLSAMTGPLVLVADTGDTPVVVMPGKTVGLILREWEHTRGSGPP
jgi:hypothetical protein